RVRRQRLMCIRDMSMTVRLTIGSLEKTLTSNEIESCAEGVMKILRKKLNAELRSK
ncbi:MAG: hypothetical protein K2H89_08950, partial [Oscillospiraceae bacterium]|nr:hypothetical protein [Oscillospiraceae bacterium]